jgi:hypothetical protein
VTGPQEAVVVGVFTHRYTGVVETITELRDLNWAFLDLEKRRENFICQGGISLECW